MKKKLPGWAVLLIITLAAGLALGGTNALTKDPIAQQALIKAENARKAALPDAESFEELPLDEGAAVDWVYAGLKDGTPIGYVAQKTVNGFGGKVEVIAGVDTKAAPDTFTIGGITVGGSDFSETAGLGARAKEPAFTDQFPGKVYPVSYIKAGGEATESTVDALTSATITTTAVVNGVNDIVKYVKADVMGIAGVEMPLKPTDGVFSASEKGFRGPVYVEAAFDAAGKVTYISVGDENFAEDIGVGVIEPDFMIQFIGKQMPLEVADIDVIAGATISSTAVVKALNNAYAIAGGAEIVVPETPTMPEKPAEGVFSAAEQGFAGPVYVEAAFNEEGKITYLGVGNDQFAETDGFGARALEPEEQYPFIGAQMPLDIGTVDTLTGATFTKTAIVNGLNKAYAVSKGEVIEEPVVEEIVMPEKPAEGVFSAAEKGFAGPVYTEAAFDADGKITYIAVGDDQFAETEGFGAKALVAENLYPFIGAQMPLNVEDVDALTGATFTKTAIVNSLNKAYAASKGEVEEEPTKEAAPAAEIETPEVTFGGDADGFQSTVHVEAAFDGDKVTAMTIGDKRFDETPGFGARALEPEAAAAFIGKTVPMKVEDIDVLTGATFTKTAVVEALNKAYTKYQAAQEAPAEEPAAAPENAVTASTQGFGGPVAVEAAFDDEGKITYIKIGDDSFAETPGLGARALEDAFQAQFIGKQMPLTLSDIDAIAGATVTSTAVVDALNNAYDQVKPAAEVEEPETTFGGDADGFQSTVHVEAAFDGDKVTSMTIGDKRFDETPGFGARALEPEVAAAFIGKTVPMDVADIDVLTGATFTKTAVVEALNKAFTKYQAAQEAPAEEPAAAPENAVTASAQGFGGPVAVEAAFDGEGKITYIKIGDDSFAETPGLGARALEDAFQAQFIGKQMPLTLADIDAITGATVTSTAVVDALNEAYSAIAAPAAEPVEEPVIEPTAEPVVEEPTPEPVPEATPVPAPAAEQPETTAEPEQPEVKAETAENDAFITVEAISFFTQIQVKTAFEDGKVADLAVADRPVGSEADYAPSAQEDELKALFLNQPLPLSVDAQFTPYAAAVAGAVNWAYGPAPAEEPAAEVVEEPVSEPAAEPAPEPVSEPAAETEEENLKAESSSLTLRVEADFENDTLISLAVLEKAEDSEEYVPCPQEEALKEKFVGLALPLETRQSSMLESVAAIAINKAYFDMMREAEDRIIGGADSPTAILLDEGGEEEPVYVGEAITFFTVIRANVKITPALTVEEVEFEEKPVGEEKFRPSEKSDQLEALFVGESLPLDVSDFDDPVQAAAAIAVNEAFGQSPCPESEDTGISYIGLGESIAFFTQYRVAAAFENSILVTFSAYKAPVGSAETTESMNCDALIEMLSGRQMPMPIEEFAIAGMPEYEVAAIEIALNQAFINSLAGLQ